MSQLPLHMYDVRHIERFLAEGKVTREQYEAFLAEIEDCSENLEKSSVRFISTDRRAYGGSSGGGD